MTERLKFNRMYAGASVCRPTRASFVTGRAPRRTNVDWAYNDGLKNLELTIAELAKTQGYTTGHFGNRLKIKDRFWSSTPRLPKVTPHRRVLDIRCKTL